MYVLGPGGVTLTLSAMDDESCSEVSSSSPLTTPGAVSPQAFVSVGVEMSPPMTLALTDIGEVDLNFWDLDLNSHSPPHSAVASTTSMLSQRSVAAPSESSLSGTASLSTPLGNVARQFFVRELSLLSPPPSLFLPLLSFLFLSSALLSHAFTNSFIIPNWPISTFQNM